MTSVICPVLRLPASIPLDGARYMRDVHHGGEMLCRLVAYHSCAQIEADERGLADLLRAELISPRPALADALTYCDMFSLLSYRVAISSGARRGL
jgi:hypothetical protein